MALKPCWSASTTVARMQPLVVHPVTMRVSIPAAVRVDANEGWTAPVIRDDQASTVMTSYGGSSVPYWVFLNGDGTVAFRLGGETDVSTLQLVMETLVTTG